MSLDNAKICFVAIVYSDFKLEIEKLESQLGMAVKRIDVTPLVPWSLTRSHENETMKIAQGDQVDQSNLSHGKHWMMLNLLGVIYRQQVQLLNFTSHNGLAWFSRTVYFTENGRRPTGDSSTCRLLCRELRCRTFSMKFMM